MHNNRFSTVFVILLVLAVCIPAVADSDESSKDTFTNSVGIEFVRIPAGTFFMGANRHFENADSDELPRHKVRITRPFYLSKYEITQAQWVAVMGSNPSHFKGRNRPVEQVSWHDVQRFIERLNARENTDKYRLPTEAEWEYAARAGGDGSYCFGDMVDDLVLYAWYYVNAGQKTHPVGRLKANDFGLHDMHGNVWEWCNDWYAADYFSHSPSEDPKGPSKGTLKVEKGGGWDSLADSCRSAYRHGIVPGKKNSALGFRLLMME